MPCSPRVFASQATTASGSPSAAAPAPVSTTLTRQPTIRESMISIDAATPAVARLASATLTPGPASRSPSTNTISGSSRGWVNLVRGTPAAAGPAQPLTEHEHDLGLEPRLDEPGQRQLGAAGVHR